ncbi:MAG TPA: site-2 protease family protein [Polyangiaceae bacterium]|nr:site-2 protease family protein [Polyangiaceae bacterium]
MRGGIRLGRLFGIDFIVDLGWPLAFLFVSLNLVYVFSTWHPAWSLPARAGVAMVAALLFFASILAHELTHALGARAFGTRTRSIRLLFFGGAADIEHEPTTPLAEFVIAFAGPLASLALGVALSVAAFAGLEAPPDEAGRFVAALGPAATLAAWLGVSNLALAAFNLLPGFPLDGGRMLHALLWALSGSAARATQWAAGVGQMIALLLVAAGCAMALGTELPLLGSGVAGGLWLAFVGWFIHSAAQRAARRALVRDALEGVPVARLVRAPVPAAPPNLDLRSLVEGWRRVGGPRPVPVVANASLLGVVRPERVRRIDPSLWSRMTVRDVMTPRSALTAAASHDDLDGALAALAEGGLDEMPVLEGDYFVGMLRFDDILRYLELQRSPAPRRPFALPQPAPAPAPIAPPSPS